MTDNIIEFSKSIKPRKRQATETSSSIDELEAIAAVEIPHPTTDDIVAFLKVLGYLRQLSDGTGRLEFDDYRAKITLDVNRVEYDEMEPQVNVGLAIEGIFPMMWHTMDHTDPDSDIVSIFEVASVAANIIGQLSPDDEE